MKPACMRMLNAAMATKMTNRVCVNLFRLDLPVDWRRRCRVSTLACIDRIRHLAGMLGHYFTAAIDIVLYLGTALGHRMLALLHVVAELLFACVDIRVNLRRRFS